VERLIITVGSGSKTLSSRLKRKEQLLLNVGRTRVLVLLLPVFTEFENDAAVLTDAITTKAKPGMRKAGWGSVWLSSLRRKEKLCFKANLSF